MKIKGRKASVVITLDPASVRKARDLGLNISKICQNALDEAIRRMESPESAAKPNSAAGTGKNEPLSRGKSLGRDLNPGPAAYEAAALPS